MHVVDDERSTGPSRREAHLIVRGREIVESGDLRRVRDTLGMPRRQMAALLGISHNTLVTWEMGISMPRREQLANVGKVIGELRRAIDEERAGTA